MFKDNSYVVRPPKILDLKERLAFEALALSMKAAVAALMSIQNITDAHAEAQSSPDEYPKPFSDDQAVALYSNVWEVVDQIHVVRELLNAIDKPSGGVEASFFQKYEVVTKLRNKMDHLQGNLSNLAENKKLRPTIFGSLSYYKYRGRHINSDGKKVRYGSVFAVPFGTITHDSHTFPMVNPAGQLVSSKTDLFEFSAFDLIFPMSHLSEDLPRLARYLDESVRKRVERMTEQRRASDGANVEALLSQSTSVIVRVQFEYGS